ncbi:SLC13 family permease [Proteiniborus sp. MB09-C3]|uniref:SLC13 family permease n=1 Tax=Proteiniborus sp. MB09-C3 TaxID=3050072 RepID=UPI0025543AA8|nr:SLC13 family permease [Proteiniborus sp. MB09-C3]WIV13550.1 SLC13 family permease [Proteiniborus sp. MB09-C3]
MNIQIVTLIALVLAIFIGFKKKINTGLVGILFAFAVGHFMIGLKGKEIINGWPTNLFFILLGMTFLFSIAKVNGTLELISKKVSSLAKGNTKLLPIIFFIMTAIISGLGPGAIVVTALMSPIAMKLAKDENIPEILMATMVVSGAIAGGLSPLASAGIIANTLGAEQGLDTARSVFLSTLVVSLILGVVLYIVFGGYKLSKKDIGKESSHTFNKEQKKTLIVILMVIVGILIFKWDIGLTAFSGAVILLLLNTVDEKDAIAAIPWSTLLLVSGVAMLVNVVTIAGGIDMLSSFLASIMTEKTASSIMAVTSGLMSAVSSASGVVLPTLIPTVPKIVEQVGGNVNPYSLINSIVVGAHMVTFSPLSTLGALTLAAATESKDKQKLFGQLLIVGIGSVIFGGLIGFLGIYNIR